MIAPHPPIKNAGKPPGRLTGLTILLVEDEAFIAEMLASWLGRLGAKVLPANSAGKGIEIFRENHERIALVIADFRLPDIDGYTMCTQLRAIKPRLPVLLTSGRYQDAAEQALLAAGPTDFIQKPYALDNALEKLLKLVSAN